PAESLDDVVELEAGARLAGRGGVVGPGPSGGGGVRGGGAGGGQGAVGPADLDLGRIGVELDVVAAPVDPPVVVAAQQEQVEDVGEAAVVPLDDVVGVGES